MQHVPSFSAAQQALIDTWEAHTAAEFELKDADAAIATMTDDPSLIHVPVELARPAAMRCAGSTPSASFPRCPRTLRSSS